MRVFYIQEKTTKILLMIPSFFLPLYYYSFSIVLYVCSIHLSYPNQKKIIIIIKIKVRESKMKN